MASTSEHRHHALRAAAAVAAALVVTGLAAAPSSARQDPGNPVVAEVRDGNHCPLQRVGTQFVRCDDLTGNGVRAPGYVPER